MTHAFHRHAVLPEQGGFVGSLWCIHAQAHDAWFISPSLAIQAPEHQCGKSTVLDVVSLLVPKPRLSSSMTAAVMFRVVDQHKPTLLIDEADNLLKLDPEKLAVVNSMHRRSSAYVERCVGEGKTLAVKRFSSWAPVAFAGIGELPTTAQDRAIVVWLRRMLPEERDTIERLRLDKPAEFEVLNRKAARWGADHFDQLRAADPQVPAALGGREADKWRPLIAIADAIGPLWGEMARHAAVQLSASVTARAGQRDYNRLLQDCRRVARSTADATIEPKVLLLALLNLKDADWSTRNRGRPITPEYMAGALRHYGIRSVKGTAGARSYHWTDFADAWRRYLPPEADDDESPATSAAEDAAITASFGDIL
jgi:putative DNA primase/helicase